ncbi:MAG: hypothetical protein QG670_2200 [Thermoproteota archaeon]|nr:hypothetical protein [Thermoproteota archaeon]
MEQWSVIAWIGMAMLIVAFFFGGSSTLPLIVMSAVLLVGGYILKSKSAKRLCKNCGKDITYQPMDIKKCPYCGRDI